MKSCGIYQWIDEAALVGCEFGISVPVAELPAGISAPATASTLGEGSGEQDVDSCIILPSPFTLNCRIRRAA
jgi:hypothetical protein